MKSPMEWILLPARRRAEWIETALSVGMGALVVLTSELLHLPWYERGCAILLGVVLIIGILA